MHTATKIDMSRSLSNLLEVVQQLQSIQDGFGVWQREHFTEKPPEFFALELCGEAGELANLEKKVWKGTVIEPHLIADEVADVFIALANYAISRGISLADAVALKVDRIHPRQQ